MKKHILTVALVMSLAVLPAYCGAKSSSDRDSTNVKNDSAEVMNTAGSAKTKSSGYVLYLSLAGCLGLVFAAGGIVWGLSLKKKYDGKLDDMEYEVGEMKTTMEELRAMVVDKEAALKSDIDNVKEDLLEEMHRKNESDVKEQVPESLADKMSGQSPADMFVEKVYYSKCPYGDGFDERDFVERQNSSLPFKITQESPVEAKVEVVQGYDPAFNSQVKEMSEASCGNWNTFETLTVETPGIIRKESAKDSFWTVDRKIKVRLN